MWCLNMVMWLEAPLSTSQTSIPWVIVHVSAQIKTYSPSLEESSLAFFFTGSSSSVMWEWYLFIFPFFLGQYLKKCPFSSQVKHLSCEMRFFGNITFLWEYYFLLFSPLLEWVIKDWLSSSLICSSLVNNRASSCVNSSHSPLNLVSLLLAQIPWLKDSHDLERPIKVVITTYDS